MNDRNFHFQLRKLRDEQGKPMTVGKIAGAIYCNRAHLNDVLNKQGGARTANSSEGDSVFGIEVSGSGDGFAGGAGVGCPGECEGNSENRESGKIVGRGAFGSTWNKMPGVKKFQCMGCGDRFPYLRRKPKYCEECRRLKNVAEVSRWKKKFRKGDAEEQYQGRSKFVALVEGMTHKAIAKELKLSWYQVLDTERKALIKIRSNHNLKKSWDTMRQQLAEGAEMGAPGGYVVGAKAKGELLLNFQSSMVKWYRLQDRLIVAECWEEAAELGIEIERFQREFAEKLKTI